MPDVSINEKLDEILAEFVTAEESDSPVSRDELLNRHPEFADELRAFFADRDQFKRLASPLSPTAARRNDLPATVRYFGDYELLEEIAQGGMGVVYKARQTSLNRIVAVKMILAGHLATDADVRRFTDEAHTAASLKHKAIVPIHEVGQQNGQHYFSMDLIEGRNLAEVIRTDPPEPKEAARIVKTIAGAVDYAHSEGIVHRDIKPSNILIDDSGQVHITDFGLALRVEGESELTRTGQVLGTPAYMPPEQARGLRDLVGPGSDIYSLGAVLYELLAGRPPFRGETNADTIRQLIDNQPTSPRQLERGTPRDLETICLKCLEKEPHKRYGTAGLLADDLGRYLAGEPILARPAGRVERLLRWSRREPAVASLTAAVALLLVIGTCVSSYFAIEARNRANAEERARSIADQRASELAVALERLDTAIKEINHQNRIISVSPSNPASRVMRGRMYARLGMWDPALADFVKAVHLGATRPEPYSEAAMLLLETGDDEGYERMCRMMLERFGSTQDAYVANKVATTCLRFDGDDETLDAARMIADRALEFAQGKRGYIEWAQLAKGLAELRAGKPEVAIKWLQMCLAGQASRQRRWDRDAEVHLALSISYWHSQQYREAKIELETAITLLDDHQPDFSDEVLGVSEWLHCQPLRREAEALIRGSKGSERETEVLDIKNAMR